MAKKNDPDLFEEFEFRPLSTGLGFHKRTGSDASSSGSPAVAQSSSEGQTLVKMPVGRGGGAASQTESPLVDNLKALYQEKATQKIKQNRVWDLEEAILEPSTSPTPVGAADTAVWRKSFFDFTALLIDAVIVVGFFMIGLATLHLAAGIDVLNVLSQGQLAQELVIAMVVLFAAVAWLYMVVARAIAGQTAGEFIFDHRLGLPEQFEEKSYIWRMALRTTLIFGTGLILFPLIEEITGKDLLGKIVNLHHYRKVQVGNRPTA